MTTNKLDFTDDELKAIREEYCQGATDAQFTLLMADCRRRGLVPGQHIFFSLRSSKEWDPELRTSKFVKKVVKVTTVEALRLIAQRTGDYEGQGDAEFIYLDANGEPTILSTIPLPDPSNLRYPREPWAARVPIFRKGFRQPTRVVCRMDAYAVLKKSDNGMVLNDIWAKRGPEMLAKCSVAGGLRASYPEEIGSMYLAEELERDERESAPEAPADPAPQTPPTPAPAPLVIPAVNHAPVEGTSDPRPEEPKVETPKPEPIPEPVQKTDDDPNCLPTAEEKTKYTATVRALPKSVNRDRVKDFLLLRAGVDATGKVSKAQWESTLSEIAEALKSGDAALNTLIHNALNKETADAAQ